MELGLRGKVVLVTGGSKGIGKATASIFAKEGAEVAIFARGLEDLFETATWIEKETKIKPLVIQGNVMVEKDCNRAVDLVVKTYGRLDILINNAGTSLQKTFEHIETSEWKQDLDLKVFAAIHLSKLALPYLKVNGGSIVNITSIVGKAPRLGSLPTSVSRAAGLALTKGMSKEFAAHNVRVNAICLGTVRSSQLESKVKSYDANISWEEYEAKFSQHIPLKRFGVAEEAANVIVFLSSRAASYVTGTAVNVDGGLVDVL